MYLLDTNVCIALLKGDPVAAGHLSRCDPAEICVSTIVRAELSYGARQSAQVTRNLTVLAAFLAPLRSVTFDEAAAEEYGLIRASLERAGQPIGPNGLLIAAIARAHDFTVVTRNFREFSRVAGLRVAVWD